MLTQRETVQDTFARQFEKLKDCERALAAAAAKHRAALEELTETLWCVYDVTHDERDPYFTPADRATRWLEQHDVDELTDDLPFANYAADEADHLWKEAARTGSKGERE